MKEFPTKFPGSFRDPSHLTKGTHDHDGITNYILLLHWRYKLAELPENFKAAGCASEEPIFFMV